MTSNIANLRVKAGRKITAHSPIKPRALFGWLAPGKTSDMSDWIDAEGFRANVGIVLMRDNGEVFLGQRTGAKGWQFPQGGVRQGEPVEQALFRELLEEIGLERRHVSVAGSTADWIRYKLPKRYVRRGRGPLCIGQKQRWYLLKLGVGDSALRFDATEQPPEFDRWRWADWWDAVHDVIYFKRQVYARVLHELGRHAFPEGLPPYPSWWRERLGERAAEPNA